MTARRKTFLALLGIGAIALAADRFIPTSENTADAMEPETAEIAIAQKPAPSATSAHSEPAPAPLLLSQRIREAVKKTSPEDSSRDIFSIPVAWSGPEKREPEPVVVAPKAPRFDESHRLTALILDGDRSGVLMDGKMIKLGQSIDGYRLLSVTNNVAIFESTADRALVRIEKSAVAASGD